MKAKSKREGKWYMLCCLQDTDHPHPPTRIAEMTSDLAEVLMVLFCMLFFIILFNYSFFFSPRVAACRLELLEKDEP